MNQDKSDQETGSEPALLRQWTMLSALGGAVVEVRDGYARGQLPLTEAVMQPTRVYHAGAIVVLADEVASAAAYGGPVRQEELACKPFPYSIQISTNLLTNDPVGPLTAEATVVRRGRVVVVDTQVMTSQGQIAALVRSTHLMVNLRTSGPHKRQSLAPERR
ncbi:MAG TPA: PaaI family thioesterase [Candidatus Obscuribacterales bacterium]